MRALTLALAVALLAATPAFAHAGGGAFDDWSFEPVLLVPLLVTAGVFGAGWLRLRARASRGAARLVVRGMLFASGWLVLAAAVVSPLHHAGARSFAAHMLEHELLMLAAAPLLVLAEPLAIMLWAFPGFWRRRIGSWSRYGAVQGGWSAMTHPLLATLAQAAALWLWHAPALFERALVDPGWHIAQHLCFFVTALFFWTAVLPGRARNLGVAVLCLFATSLVSGALGAMMAFAHSPWYAEYARLGLAPFGLSPLEDQQLAGMLMWVPGGLVHAAGALAAMGKLLKSEQKSCGSPRVSGRGQ